MRLDPSPRLRRLGGPTRAITHRISTGYGNYTVIYILYIGAKWAKHPMHLDDPLHISRDKRRRLCYIFVVHSQGYCLRPVTLGSQAWHAASRRKS